MSAHSGCTIVLSQTEISNAVSQMVDPNTLRPRQNGRDFPDDIFKRIFLNENVWTSIEFSVKFASNVRIDNIPALVQIMAWRRPGDKPLSEPMVVTLLTHICVTRPQWIEPVYSVTWSLVCAFQMFCTPGIIDIYRVACDNKSPLYAMISITLYFAILYNPFSLNRKRVLGFRIRSKAGNVPDFTQSKYPLCSLPLNDVMMTRERCTHR